MKDIFKRPIMITIKYIAVAAAVVSFISLSGVTTKVDKNDAYSIEVEQNVPNNKSGNKELQLEDPVFRENDDADKAISQEAERVYGDENVFELLGN